MGSSPAGLCCSLLLLVLSSILLEATALSDYKNRPRPVFDFEGGPGFRFGRRVENLPHDWNAAAAPSAAAPSASAPSAAAPVRSPQVYATVEKNFNDASLGQVISAAPEDLSSSPSTLIAQEAERATEGTAKIEDVGGSQIEVDIGHQGGDIFQSSVFDPVVSRMGPFFVPRPVLGPEPINGPLCKNPDETQGVCTRNRFTCRLRRGSFSHSCAGNNGVCCVFQHKCSAFTGERVSYYQNPSFPFNDTGNLVCNYKVKIAPKICAIRADFLNYSTPITAICSETQLAFLIGNNTRTIPVCGVLTGSSMLFELTPPDDKEFVISHILGGKEPYKFNIQITQVLCSAIKPIEESACGRQNIGMVRHKRSARLPSGSAAFRTNSDSDTSFGGMYPFPLLPRMDTSPFLHLPAELELEDDISSDDQMVTRIVGGRVARVNEWPWQVALFKRQSLTLTTRYFFCGGTLINREYILTAAHCVARFIRFNHTDMSQHIIAAIGDHDLRFTNESMQVFRGIKRIIHHPLYDRIRNQNDIALLQLSSPVNYTGAIAPVCLPDAPRSMAGKDINVSGWGVIYFNGSRRGPRSPVLKTTTVKGVSREECEKKWKIYDNPNTVYEELPPISEQQGCVDNKPGAACFGDSGGPVTFKEENGRFTLIGTVSIGPLICTIGGPFPTIYTRIAAYMSWIRLAIIDMF